MKDTSIAENNTSRDDLRQFCKEVHRQTGVFLRVTQEDDLESLAGLVKLSCSPNLQASFERLHPYTFLNT